MAKPYEVSITNGTGSAAILNGSYTITSVVTGYDNTSILPKTQEVSSGVNTYSFTVAATGTLTLHVTVDGTAEGTAIEGATFSRCDSAGEPHGSPIISDENGNAVFQYVPFAATGAPLIYYKQTASDGEHEFDPALVNTTMTSSTKTVEVTNAAPANRTINATDANYSGLPIAAGTLTFN